MYRKSLFIISFLCISYIETIWAENNLLSCPDGQTRTIDTDGHCCWAGQSWNQGKQKCIGKPDYCPPFTMADSEGCVSAKVEEEAASKQNIPCIKDIMEDSIKRNNEDPMNLSLEAGVYELLMAIDQISDGPPIDFNRDGIIDKFVVLSAGAQAAFGDLYLSNGKDCFFYAGSMSDSGKTKLIGEQSQGVESFDSIAPGIGNGSSVVYRYIFDGKEFKGKLHALCLGFDDDYEIIKNDVSSILEKMGIKIEDFTIDVHVTQTKEDKNNDGLSDLVAAFKDDPKKSYLYLSDSRWESCYVPANLISP